MSEDVTEEQIESVLELYRKGKISLGRVAENLGMYYDDTIELLKNRGEMIRVGPDSLDEAEKEIEVIRNRESDRQ